MNTTVHFSEKLMEKAKKMDKEIHKYKSVQTVCEELHEIKEVQIADQLRYLKLKERVDLIEENATYVQYPFSEPKE